MTGHPVGMGVLHLECGEKPAIESEWEHDLSAHAQIASLKKYERYLMAIATDEMQTTMVRKFGPSDVVQQTFQQAVTNATSFRGSTEQQFRGWLRTILMNQLRQNVRELSCEKRDIRRERSITNQPERDGLRTTDPPDRWPTPSTTVAASEENLMLQQALTRLPQRYQTVIRLRNWEKLSFTEIGKRLNLSSDAVKKVWYRALLRLQKHLE